MDNGWEDSSGAWIADMGEYGDFSRKYVLDPIMLSRALKRSPRQALDVGCGEGRFCRLLRPHGIQMTGVDPTPSMVAASRQRDPDGVYLEAQAEQLPLGDNTFDLVISYLSLIDIDDFRAGILEMARVLKPGGSLLIANINSFITAAGDAGWVKDSAGHKLHYPIDNYLEERAMWLEYRGIRVVNHHRPLSAYLRSLLEADLRLSYFDEPVTIAATSPSRAAAYRRVPWFLVMEWLKPGP